MEHGYIDTLTLVSERALHKGCQFSRQSHQYPGTSPLEIFLLIQARRPKLDAIKQI